MERLKDMFLGFMVYLLILGGLYLFSDRPSSEAVPLVSQEETAAIKRNGSFEEDKTYLSSEESKKATEISEDRLGKSGSPESPLTDEPLNSTLPKRVGSNKKSLEQETFLSIISPSDKGRELK